MLFRSYSQKGDPAGVSEALASSEYPTYKQALHEMLKGMFPSGLVPVRHLPEYAGYKDTGKGPMSVSINPKWGEGAQARGQEVQSFEVPIDDVIAAGNGAEGELIIKRPKEAEIKEPGKRAKKDIAKAEEGATEAAKEQAQFVEEVDQNINDLLTGRLREMSHAEGLSDQDIPSQDYRASEVHNFLRVPALFTQ